MNDAGDMFSPMPPVLGLKGAPFYIREYLLVSYSNYYIYACLNENDLFCGRSLLACDLVCKNHRFFLLSLFSHFDGLWLLQFQSYFLLNLPVFLHVSNLSFK